MPRIVRYLCAFALLATISTHAQNHPWSNKDISPDDRADLVVKEMTLDEKILLVHGGGWTVLMPNKPIPAGDNFGAGFVSGIPRLGIPDINMADSAVGIRMAAYQARYATLYPSTLGAAASWDADAALLYGQSLGRELRQQGFNMTIGGGVDLMREPRNGRNFEYAGEDPLLAGTIDRQRWMKGVASQHIMNDIKHYALNDQETGRNVVNAVLDPSAPCASPTCSPSRSPSASPSPPASCAPTTSSTATTPARTTTSSTRSSSRTSASKASSSPTGTPPTPPSKPRSTAWTWSSPANSTASLTSASLSQRPFSATARSPWRGSNDMVHRILRSMFAAGVIDDPPVRTVVDPFRGRDEARHIAEESIVLLRNEKATLPLAPTIKSIAVIGGHADIGVLSGGGSAQVDAPGGNALGHKPGGADWGEPVYFPSVPLTEIAAHAPAARVAFNDGTDPAAAAAFAKPSDVAIVFVTQYLHEESDAPSLSLPGRQDDLIAAVAAANPHTIVVIESGGPITMPWFGNVTAILEAWYPGIGGAQALADILFGVVNPSGKLPATFARSEADLPHPVLPGSTRVFPAGTGAGVKNHTKAFDIDYSEGARVGYKWFDSENKQPLYPFGFGLSYTTFAYSGLIVDASQRSATLTVKNMGKRDGTEVAELYAQLPGDNFKRLVGFRRVWLTAGATQTVTIPMNQLTLSIFDTDKNAWVRPFGQFQFFAGGSSRDLPLHMTTTADGGPTK